MLKKEIIAYLAKNNFVPSKKMGQNFLINDAIKRNIVSAAQIITDDKILEIGPGLGAITQYILAITDQFIAIELDKRLAAHLKSTFPQLNLINDDILRIDLCQLFCTSNWNKVKVIANLPYSISSKIILKLLVCDNVTEIYILVQKEMAERVMANVNTHAYNAFSALVQKFSKIDVQFKVGAQEFVPSPQVDSLFIHFSKYTHVDVEFSSYDTFLRQCFCARRKKLSNNLANYYPKVKINEVFEQLKIDINSRAEQLDNPKLTELYKMLGK